MVMPRKSTYSTTRSCLPESGASLARRPATLAARRHRAAIMNRRSEKLLPSAVRVPGLSLTNTQAVSKPNDAARNTAAASNRDLLRSSVSPTRLAIVPSAIATAAGLCPA